MPDSGAPNAGGWMCSTGWAGPPVSPPLDMAANVADLPPVDPSGKVACRGRQTPPRVSPALPEPRSYMSSGRTCPSGRGVRGWPCPRARTTGWRSQAVSPRPGGTRGSQERLLQYGRVVQRSVARPRARERSPGVLPPGVQPRSRGLTSDGTSRPVPLPSVAIVFARTRPDLPAAGGRIGGAEPATRSGDAMTTDTGARGRSR